MKIINSMKKLISFLFCICISIGLVACVNGGDSGSPLKKVYDELYQSRSEYKIVLDNYFGFLDEKELKKEYPELNVTGVITGKYKKGNDTELQLVANMTKLFEENLGGLKLNPGEFCKANNGYYYAMLYTERGNMCLASLFESKDKKDMEKLDFKQKK